MILTNEQLRKLQLKETEILKEIDRLCRKHKIYYSLMYGTLIGALRHKGFIPWDDDIDILMTRDNFDKFLNVLNELDDKFFYIDSYTNKHYGLRFGKVMMKNTIMQEKITSKKVPCGIFIDIFVVEKTSLDEKKQIKQFNDYWTLRRICLRRSHYITKNNPISRFFFKLFEKLRKETNAKISFDINYRDDIFSSPKEAKEIFLSVCAMTTEISRDSSGCF